MNLEPEPASASSSPVVNGRCMGCGRFIKKTESHFHTKRQKRSRSTSTSRTGNP